MKRKLTGIAASLPSLKTGWIFTSLWILVFVLYLPAARAGRVADFSGWLDQTVRYGFWDNINRTHYSGRSLYQFTQLCTWLFYQVVGAGPWPWHLLFITLHACNATLLYYIVKRLLDAPGIKNGSYIAALGAILFSASPYISEVIVWEPSYHFLQGFLLILLNLYWVQQYIFTGKSKNAWFSVSCYLLSTFSLEIFYIAPWLVLSLALFYKFSNNTTSQSFRKVIFYFVAPQLILFGLHLVLFHAAYGGWVAHLGTETMAVGIQGGWGRPAKNLFHILFLGRFMPVDIRKKVYEFCDSAAGLIVFYGLLLSLCLYIVTQFKKFTTKGKVAALLVTWLLITLAILVPLWVDDIFLVVYDRYIYFSCGFAYMLLTLLLSYVTIRYLRIALAACWLLVNLRFVVLVSRYWMKSASVIEGLLNSFPYSTDKTVILLNLPQNMHGVPMIGAEKESEFKLMHNLLLPKGHQPIHAPVYDAMAYNMLTPADGATASFINDSTVQVTLNQCGTWWWFAMRGGQSYENEAYKIDMKNPGHMYELTLKHPRSNYLLLYQDGRELKIRN